MAMSKTPITSVELNGGEAGATLQHSNTTRIGVDFGGTKIEAAALDAQGNFLARVRAPTPGNYEASLGVVCELVDKVEQQAGSRGSVGVGTPGSISPRTGTMRNAN